MTADTLSILVGLAGWAAWSLAWFSARASRIAKPLGRPIALAERDRP